MENVSLDKVSISVPARQRMLKVIRMATTAVASRAGMNIDQADDLNTALDELFRSYLTQHENNDTDFCVTYCLFPDRLEIVTEGCTVSDGKDKVGRYSRFLLESMSDRLEEVPNPHGGCDVIMIKNLSRQ